MSGVSMATGVSAVDILGGLPDGSLAAPILSPATAAGSGIFYGSGGAGRMMLVVSGVGEFYLSGTTASLKSTTLFGWPSAAAGSSAIDAGFARNAVNTVEVNNGTAGVFAALKAALITAAAGTATPAGGAAAASVRLGTTATLGLYYGSGLPTVTAAQGSLYIRSDGSSTSTRLYVNTDGGTTWTNVTTAA